jgi:OmpA-OmpF porin, OOP family
VNIKQAIALTGLIAATAGISPLAFAQDSGWYVGASAGQSKVKDFCPNPVAVGTSCDDTSGTYGVFGGYQFNRYLGAELGYTDFGENKVFGSGAAVTWKVKGLELLGVGIIPINPYFEIYGKVGAFLWDVKQSCTGASCLYSSQSETGSDLTYALGAQFNFTRNISARVQYQRYQDVGDQATTGKSDMDLLSFGIVFRF